MTALRCDRCARKIAVLTAIDAYHARHQMAPTIDEIVEAVQGSVGGVYPLILECAEAGLLVRRPHVFRSMRVTERGRAELRAVGA